MAEHLDLFQPTTEPIQTRGNAFWRGRQRFLIKGISYIPRSPGGVLHGTRIDALNEDRLDHLRRDLEILHELGLNTIVVEALDPTHSHATAMSLLAKAGIYVLVKVCEGMEKPDVSRQTTASGKNFDTAPFYTADLLKRALQIVDQFAEYSNTLGFMMNGQVINSTGVSKIAEASRAAVADIKAFLHVRGGRQVPVGITVSDVMELRMNLLQYFTAGRKEERVDFFSHNCYCWAMKSNFLVSGWKDMVEAFEKYPVPMFLSQYGANVGRHRFWDEVECLYSPDMTGVFSGGCMYTYFEHGNNYGIVTVGRDGQIEKKQEFKNLRKHFDVVNMRAPDELMSPSMKNYEEWFGNFPETGEWWFATSNLPKCQVPLGEIVQELLDAKEWELVERVSGMNIADERETLG